MAKPGPMARRRGTEPGYDRPGRTLPFSERLERALRIYSSDDLVNYPFNLLATAILIF